MVREEDKKVKETEREGETPSPSKGTQKLPHAPEIMHNGNMPFGATIDRSEVVDINWILFYLWKVKSSHLLPQSPSKEERDGIC